MFLNIITPCSRPFNLIEIGKSINIPVGSYRWIVVFDSEMIPNGYDFPKNAELFCHKDPVSISGNAQRNFALDRITEGHVYVNDDDTVLHPELWENIKELDDDFISFSQDWPDGSLRLSGENILVGHIDSHNFIVANRTIKETRWILQKYEADGFFAQECYTKASTKKYIQKTLSIYNKLRE